MPTPTLFISYSSRSQGSADLAHELAHSLRNDGYEVFLDKDDLPAGESFDDRIGQAIARSDGMIFLAAPEALQPGAYTLTELGHAKRTWRSGRGRVLPVLLGDAPMERLDPYLRVLNVLRPVGNARAEILAEARRLWPVAANVPPAAPKRGLAGASGKRLVLSAVVLAALCVAGFLGLQEMDAIMPDPTDRTMRADPSDALTAETASVGATGSGTTGEAAGGGTRGGGTTGADAGSPPGPGGGGRSPELDRALALREHAEPLLKLVREAVSGDEYDSPSPDALRPSLSASTIADIVAWQRETRTGPENEQTVGAYQLVSADVTRLASSLALAPDARFTPEVQDAMAAALLGQSGLAEFLEGQIGEAEFANEVAKLWAVVPVVADTTGPDGGIVARGASYYQSYGKRPRVTPERVLATLRDVRMRAG